MLKEVLSVAAVGLLLSGCAGTSGPSPQKVGGGVDSNVAYLADGSGKVVLTGYSRCTRVSVWSEDNELLDCEPEKAAAAKAAADAEAERMAKEKAEAERLAAEEAAKAERLAAEKAAADRAAAAAAEPIVMNLSGRALFASGSAEMTAAGNSAFQSLIERLAEYKVIDSITIIGHTDSQGAAAYNQMLSEKRAETVRGYIADSGVGGDAKLIVEGKGETDPIASNDTADGRQQNRRVEVRVRGLN